MTTLIPQDQGLVHLGLDHLLDPLIAGNPYPYLARLRREDPVHFDPLRGVWIVTSYDLIAAVLRDPRFSAERFPVKQTLHQAPDSIARALSRQMLFLDPPDHTRIRRLFTKAFTPSRMDALRPEVLQQVNELLDQAVQSQDSLVCADFLQSFAIPLPVRVISQMLGVPIADRDKLRTWSLAFSTLIDGRNLTRNEVTVAQKGIVEFVAYFSSLIEARRKAPQDDMLSDLIAAEEQGCHLSTHELIVNLILLLAAGHSTTTHLLGNGLLALYQNPAIWQQFVADRSLVSLVTAEILRFDGPVQATAREALEDLEFGGKLIRAGQNVTLLLNAANHDPVWFPEPDQFLLRNPPARSLAFGHGIHTCLGAALARLESDMAFTEIARRFPNIRVDLKAVVRDPSISFRSLLTLPVTLE